MPGLTDAEVRGAKPKPKPYKLSDGGWLFVWVTPSGSKLWRLAYRFAGREKTLSLGPYPSLSIKEARRLRDAAKQVLARGGDPMQERRQERAEQAVEAATTFEDVAKEYLKRKETDGWAAATLKKNRWLLEQSYRALGPRPVAAIKPAEVLAVLRKVEKRGRLETAGRMRELIGRVFRHAIATARAENDPTTALRGALFTPKVKHRAAITDPKALGALLRAIDEFDGQPTTLAALKILPMVFTRPGELRLARWSEFDFDGAVWTIPAERTKMRREHRVPLPRQAISILKDLHSLTGYGDLVFPSLRTARRPISENTMNAALRRLGYSKDEVTAHGFRATASTLLNESGKFSPDAIERALAHQEPDDSRRPYNRAEYWKERVKMAQSWADYLDQLRAGGRVIPLRQQA